MPKYSYLFKLPLSTYNNERPFYEIFPLPDSDISKMVVFCGKRTRSDDSQGLVYLYFEAKQELNQNNRFHNFQKPLNLIFLATGLPIKYESIDLEHTDTYDLILEKFGSKKFYNSKINYSGTVHDENPISRVRSYSYYLNMVPEEVKKKFFNALNTYCTAEEINMLPDPQFHYTLVMTLFLSSINQLSKQPGYCTNSDQLICKSCNKDFARHWSTSHTKETLSLINEIVVSKNKQYFIDLVDRLFNSVRNEYLHEGVLRGMEEQGGFLFNERGTELLEDQINLASLNRSLI